MADVHHVITLGIGTPADIPHLTLVGLSVNPSVAAALLATTALLGTAVTSHALAGTQAASQALVGTAVTQQALRGTVP